MDGGPMRTSGKQRSLLARRVHTWYRATLEEDVYLALRIALSYLLFGGLWILLSDRLLVSLVQDAELLSRLQTVKGWLFVIVTALLLHLFIWSAVRARRKLREQKRESERFLETLIENLPGIVYRCRDDAEWTMQYMSPGAEQLLGYRADELVGSGDPSFGSLIHEGDRERVDVTVREALDARRPFQVEYRIRTRAGDTRWVWEQGQGVFEADDRLSQIEGFITDVTERHESQERIKSQMRRLRALRAIDLAIMGSLDLRITLEVVLDQVTSQLAVDAAAVLVFDEQRELLERKAGRGFHPDTTLRTRFRLGLGPAGRAALRRERVRLDSLAEARAEEFDWLSEEEGFTTYLAVPLATQGKLRGVLELLHRAPLPATEDWLEFLETLAGQAAIAIDNACLFEGLERANMELRVAYDQAIEGWARALDLRDHETEGHSRRVMELTLLLAERLEIPGEEMVHIRRGALLHDIGKIGIPDRILLKPGPLTEEERAQMQRHTQYAVDLLSPMPFLEPALDIPHYHHERWDGGGYPEGLSGKEIPLAARIFAVADVWDALRSDRPYRHAWPEDKVRDHLRGEAGRHFDPEVVEAFLAIEPDEIARIERGTRREPMMILRRA